MNLNDIQPLPGTRDYLEANWFSPGDILLAHSEDPDGRAFSELPDHIQENFQRGLSADPADIPAFNGIKYDCYGAYGKFVQPKSIIEIGVAAGYSIAGMIYGAGGSDGSVKRVTLVDKHEDIFKTVTKLRTFFPNIDFTAHHLDSQAHWEQVPRQIFDIVHVDAEHTYSGALADLRHFGVLVAFYGLIVIDDTRDPEIERACQQFAREHNMLTRFMDNHNGHTIMARSTPKREAEK